MIDIQEQVYIIYLNSNNEVICWRCLNTGTTTECNVDIKLALACGLLCLAVNVIIAHNHPSGSLTPSHDDRSITSKLFKALQLMDITLVDHLILTRLAYLSFVDSGIKLA